MSIYRINFYREYITLSKFIYWYNHTGGSCDDIIEWILGPVKMRLDVSEILNTEDIIFYINANQLIRRIQSGPTFFLLRKITFNKWEPCIG